MTWVKDHAIEIIALQARGLGNNIYRDWLGKCL